jgi:hypothetical protein
VGAALFQARSAVHPHFILFWRERHFQTVMILRLAICYQPFGVRLGGLVFGSQPLLFDFTPEIPHSLYTAPTPAPTTRLPHLAFRVRLSISDFVIELLGFGDVAHKDTTSRESRYMARTGLDKRRTKGTGWNSDNFKDESGSGMRTTTLIIEQKRQRPLYPRLSASRS